MLVVREWLQDFLGEGATPDTQTIIDLLTFHAFEIEGVTQVNGQDVIDVDVLPNRSSDCLSHRGIARELATLTNTQLAYDPLAQTVDLPKVDTVSVDIQDEDGCSRFTATVIEGITVKESPKWLQERLQAIGQRPINNIVDATNYVMFALGQPLHAYDAERFPQIDGTWQFQVRPAQAEEIVSLIAESGKDEDRTVTLDGGELLIVDGSSNTPIGLAGVKGGRYAGVDEHTTKIIVEAAHFDPVLTRKTARKLGIVIDASKRFENEPSVELSLYAQAQIVQLITEIAGGTCMGMIDVYPHPRTVPTVTVSIQKANTLLGLTLSGEEMIDLLVRAGIHVTSTDDDTLRCTGPFERTDLNISEDFIEEIGRIYGYDHVQSISPERMTVSEYNARHYYSEKVRDVLVAEGFSEIITSTFRKKDEIQLRNALASDKSCLRSSLRKNISDVLDRNAGFVDLFGVQDTRVFEIGTVFSKRSGDVAEHVSLCFGVRIKQSGYSGKEDKRIKATVALLEETLGVSLQVNIEKGIAELDFTQLLTQLPPVTAYDEVALAQEKSYAPFSIYPFVTRDIALWVTESTEASQVETVLNEAAGALRVRTTLFDEFTKDGRTSYAFRLVFQSDVNTLTDSEVNTVMDGVYAAVAKYEWEVR